MNLILRHLSSFVLYTFLVEVSTSERYQNKPNVMFLDPSTGERPVDLCELETSLVYRAS